MIRQFKYRDITWIDATNPSKEELTAFGRDYKIHSLVENELAEPSHRSHLDTYENYLYLVLHFPACRFCLDGSKDTSEDTQEVDFIIGRDFLLTIHYEPIQTLEEFGQIIEANLRAAEANKDQTGFLFYQILLRLYGALDAGLSYIGDELKKAEGNIFSGKEKETVVVLSKINREILDFNWVLKAHPEIISLLETKTG